MFYHRYYLNSLAAKQAVIQFHNWEKKGLWGLITVSGTLSIGDFSGQALH